MTDQDNRHALQIDDLHVYYDQSHALQGVSFDLEAGVLSVVGRNGMGKTTLCNAIMGLVPVKRGAIRIMGQETTRYEPHRIHACGVAYVPQGRRCWRDLTVDEHLRLAESRKRDGAWPIERIYQVFPRLAERRGNGGSDLSGGEQQMLAIARALVSNPHLLIMDEPTEGLAPMIVEQLRKMLVELAATGEMAILLVEQNIHVATTVADRVAIMINGQINRIMPAAELAADRDLQQRLLGVGRHGDDDASEAEPVTAPVDEARKPPDGSQRPVIVAGTFDTKARELGFVADKLRALGVPVRTVDLSTSGRKIRADVRALEVAAMAPGGVEAVMTGERGVSVTAMGQAFARWIAGQSAIGGVISAGGSGGTSIATCGMQALGFGIPKIMVSTMASGNVENYVGASDIMMLHSVADVQGLNRITERVLSNAAHAMAGMIIHHSDPAEAKDRQRKPRPAIGLTMFGVTTPAVQAVTKALEHSHDCLVFHATGIGGRSMEALVDSGMMAGVIDLTTTEVADMIVGGLLPATEDRFGAVIRTGVPFVGSVGALDMVNFGPRESVPQHFEGRDFVIHNANVTLMRTTPEENRQFGQWIGERLTQMTGPVRFLLPEGGVSALDVEGQPFFDPKAREALFEAIENAVSSSPNVQLERLPIHINDPAFAKAVVAAFRAISA